METEEASDHDVVWVINSDDDFGDYLMYRTYLPRPVVGTHGLQAVAWDKSYTELGGMHFQNAIPRIAKRPPVERDYTAWLGFRALADSAMKSGKTTPQEVKAYLLSDAFKLEGFQRPSKSSLGSSKAAWLTAMTSAARGRGHLSQSPSRRRCGSRRSLEGRSREGSTSAIEDLEESRKTYLRVRLGSQLPRPQELTSVDEQLRRIYCRNLDATFVGREPETAWKFLQTFDMTLGQADIALWSLRTRVLFKTGRWGELGATTRRIGARSSASSRTRASNKHRWVLPHASFGFAPPHLQTRR